MQIIILYLSSFIGRITLKDRHRMRWSPYFAFLHRVHWRAKGTAPILQQNIFIFLKYSNTTFKFICAHKSSQSQRYSNVVFNAASFFHLCPYRTEFVHVGEWSIDPEPCWCMWIRQHLKCFLSETGQWTILTWFLSAASLLTLHQFLA